MSCLIIFKSITHGQNAVNILARNGISASLIRPPISLSKGSCSYAVKFDDRKLKTAMEAINKTGLVPVGTFIESGDRKWNEVK